MPTIFASTGSPGRIFGDLGINVQLDCITRISRGSEYTRTTTALEKGAALTIHRQRVPQMVTMDVIVSDMAPVFGAQINPLIWEPNHAALTLGRLEDAQASNAELRIFDGIQLLRTPAGTKVWVLDNIEHQIEGTEAQVLRATLTFGESPRFATLFTPALPDAAAGLADVVGGSADRGRQSGVTTTVPGAAVFP